MTAVTIPLSEERLERLRELAREAQVSPEEFLRARVEALLDQPDEGFARVADYVLRKNAELYRRLA